MNSPDLPDLGVLLPQSGPMRLLDRAIVVNETHAHAQATLGSNHPFADAEGRVAAWIGVELMAQCIALYAGARAQRAGRPPHIGYLVSSREFKAASPLLPAGRPLDVIAHCQFADPNGMHAFRCEVRDGKALLISANVNCFDDGAA